MMNENQENLNLSPEEETPQKDLTREANVNKQEAAQAAEDIQKAREAFKDDKVGVEHPHEEKDTSYMDEYVEDRSNKLSIGKILKYVFYGILIFVFVLLVYRMFTQGKDYADYFVWTDEAIEAYQENGKLTVWTQEMSSASLALERDENNIPIKENQYVYTYSPFSEREIVRYVKGSTTETETVSFRGVYKVAGQMYIEETKQFVVTFRVNRTANEVLMNYYYLDSKPSGDVYIFTLKDSNGKVYTDYDYVTFTENTYYYYRLVFNGVDYPFFKNYLDIKESDIIELSLNVYYKDLYNVSSPVDTMTVGNNLITPKAFDLGDALPAQKPSDLANGYDWSKEYPTKED